MIYEKTNIINSIQNKTKNQINKLMNKSKKSLRFGTLRPPQGTTQKLKFCKTTNNSDFKLKYVKKFLRRFC